MPPQGVILITLVFQGLTLPLIIKKVNYQDPDQRLPENEQELAIRLQLLKVASTHLDEKFAKSPINNELVENLKNRMESELFLTNQHLNALACDAHQIIEYNQLVNEIITVKRRELHRLRRKQDFDDEVIRKEEAQLDLEEEKIDHPIH